MLMLPTTIHTGSSRPEMVSPCVNYTVFGKAPYTRFTNGKIIALFLTPQNCFSTTGCDTANFDIYVKSIRVFSCANNWNAVCLTNPIIQSSLGQKLKSWASLAGGIISSLWVTPAQAQTVNDSFEGHFRGLWRCPDGHWGYAIMCEPAEFRGKKWWEGCLPQR